MLGAGPLQGSFNGYVEGIAEDGTLRGWVYTRASLKGRVQVAICAGDTVLEAGYADRNRRDVAAAHGCEAECGFLFSLSDLMFSEIQKAGGTVTVRTLGADEQKLGEVVMQSDTADPEPHKMISAPAALRCATISLISISCWRRLRMRLCPKLFNPPLSNTARCSPQTR